MYELKLRRKMSVPAVYLFENDLRKKYLETSKCIESGDALYSQIVYRLFRLTILADSLYHDSCFKRKRITGPKREFIGLHYELFFLYLRTIYDYFAILVDKEIGEGKLPHNFNKLVKKIRKGDLSNFEKRCEERTIKFIKSDNGFSDLKNIRDSLKMKMTTLKVDIKDEHIYITGLYDTLSESKKIDNFGYQIIYNYCAMTAIWMYVIYDLIDKNYKK